jgi:hypothetical protein
VRFVVSVNPDVAATVEGEQVNRTVTLDLVGHVEIPAPGVADLGDVHRHLAYGPRCD